MYVWNSLNKMMGSRIKSVFQYFIKVSSTFSATAKTEAELVQNISKEKNSILGKIEKESKIKFPCLYAVFFSTIPLLSSTIKNPPSPHFQPLRVP